MSAEFGDPLSEREREIVVLVAQGLANKEIGARLHLSPNTVKVHLRNIFAKTGAVSRTELTITAVREGWIAVPGAGLDAGVGTEPEDGPVGGDADAPVPGADAEVPDALGLAERPGIPETPAASEVEAATVPGEGAFKVWPAHRWGAILTGLLLTLGILFFPARISGGTGGPASSGAWVDPLQTAGEPVHNDLETWEELAALPVRRARLGLAYLNDRLYAVGGMTPDGVTDQLDIYDIKTDRWTEGAPRPVALANMGAAALEGGIVVPGGCDSAGRPSALVHRYDPQSGRWTEAAALPRPLCGYALTVWGGRIYLFGGWDGSAIRTGTLVYDPAADRWEERAAPAVARQFGAAAGLGDWIYYVGGYDNRQELDTCEVYWPREDRWESCPRLLQPRGGLGLIGQGAHLYAIGGGWSGYLGFNEQYTPGESRWVPIETPLVGEWRNLGITASDTAIYTVGGWHADYLNRTYTLETLPFRIFIPSTIP